MRTKIQQLQAMLPLKRENGGADALLVTTDVNRKYLTGFASSAGAVLITPEKAWFFTDFRYIEAAQQTVTDCAVICYDRLEKFLEQLFRENGVKKVMVEQEGTSLAQMEGMSSALKKVRWINHPWLDKQLKAMRSVKSDAEIENLRQAQTITENAFEHILGFLKPGVTEREAALELEFFMRKQGAERVSFDLIVVSGKNSSLPHGVPGDKKLESGDFITMDTGAVVGGMHADMTRTVALGPVSEEQKKIYDIVLQAQMSAIAAVKSGVRCVDVDAAARNVIKAAGYGEYFGHSTGHSVGLEIHESPAFSPRSEDVAQEGMVLTVEPGIYLPGKFGVRIEDMVLVTRDGCENLTHAKKDLIIL